MAGTWSPFVAKLGEVNGYQLRQYHNTTGTTFTVRGTGGIDDPKGTIEGLNNGIWHHLAGVWDRDAGNRFLYVNGVLDTGGSIQDGTDTGSMNLATWEYLTFGSRDINGSVRDFGVGKLDEIRIYNEALSQVQVQALMVPEPSVSLVAGILGIGLLVRRRR